MPKRAKELSALEVRRLGAGVHAVGGIAGLCLQVSEGAGKSWLLRVRIGARRREIGLGPFPEVGLALARQKASEMKEEIRRGIDPVESRKAARSQLAAEQRRGLTFAEAVDAFAPIKMAELSPGNYRETWRNSLDVYAVPKIGPMLVHEIGVNDILRVLEPIWSTKTVTADKLRRKLNEVLDFVTAKGERVGPNPARWDGNLSHLLPAAASVSGHENYPSLQLADVPKFWASLTSSTGMGAEALRFQILSATRTSAIRFMTWSEVDLSTRLWTVQPGRKSAKIGRRDGAKRVPLTDDMVELLGRLPREENCDFVFWGSGGRPMSDATMGKVVRTIHARDIDAGGSGFVDVKTGEVVVPHGFRTTFKVWATERTEFDWNFSEAALWHRLGNKVEQAYARTDVVEKRRAMMDSWGQFLQGS